MASLARFEYGSGAGPGPAVHLMSISPCFTTISTTRWCLTQEGLVHSLTKFLLIPEAIL